MKFSDFNNGLNKSCIWVASLYLLPSHSCKVKEYGVIRQQKWFNIIVTNIREKVGGARGRENSTVPLCYRGVRGAYFIH